MNLVAGAMTFPVLVGFNASLTRSEDVVHQMEAVSQGDLAAVLTRNLLVSWVFVWWMHSYLRSMSGKSGTLSCGSRRGQARKFQRKIGWSERERTVSGC